MARPGPKPRLPVTFIEIGKADLTKAVKYAREGDVKMVIRHLMALEIATLHADGWSRANKDFLDKLLVKSAQAESTNPSVQQGVTPQFGNSLIERWLKDNNAALPTE